VAAVKYLVCGGMKDGEIETLEQMLADYGKMQKKNTSGLHDNHKISRTLNVENVCWQH